jgi:hypothetical protein
VVVSYVPGGSLLSVTLAGSYSDNGYDKAGDPRLGTQGSLPLSPLGRRGPPLARTTLRLPPNRACAFQRTRLSVPLDLRSESLAGSCSNRRWMISACISRTFPLIVSNTQNCRPSPDRSAVSVRSPVPYALDRPPHRRLSRPLRRAFEYYDGSVAMQLPLAGLFRRSRSCAREKSRCV